MLSPNFIMLPIMLMNFVNNHLYLPLIGPQRSTTRSRVMYMVHLPSGSGQSGDKIDLIEFIGDESDDPGQSQHQEVLNEPVTSILDRLRPPLKGN